MITKVKNKFNKFIANYKKNSLVKDVFKNVELVQKQVQNKDIVLLCLLQNGTYFIPSFMEHYTALGFKNFVFLDNDSSDNSVELLKEYNCTILKTNLPYKTYKWVFKQYLVKKFGVKKWSLYVDIDELWDFPASDKIELTSFVKYLDKNNFNAVQSHMLDMFSGESLNNLMQFKDANLKKAYTYYDNSGLIEKKYTAAYNTINNPETRHYWGGVHHSIFGIKNIYISKIPLIKWDKTISVHESSHTSTFINIADVSTVLLHYKFVLGFYEKAHRILKDGAYWNAGETYKKYLTEIENNENLSLKTSNARKFVNCQLLVNEGFLMDSKPYGEFVKNVECVE